MQGLLPLTTGAAPRGPHSFFCTGKPLYKQGSDLRRPLLIGWIAYVEVAWHE
jgi:hypothetical protein